MKKIYSCQCRLQLRSQQKGNLILFGNKGPVQKNNIITVRQINPKGKKNVI